MSAGVSTLATKAAAGMAAAVIVTAGAVEVKHVGDRQAAPPAQVALAQPAVAPPAAAPAVRRARAEGRRETTPTRRRTVRAREGREGRDAGHDRARHHDSRGRGRAVPPVAPVQEDGSTVDAAAARRARCSPSPARCRSSRRRRRPRPRRPPTTPVPDGHERRHAARRPPVAQAAPDATAPLPEGHARSRRPPDGAALAGAPPAPASPLPRPAEPRPARSTRLPRAVATFDQFLEIDMRVGRVTAVDDFPEARKPAWKLHDRLRHGDRRAPLLGAGQQLHARGARGPAGRGRRELPAAPDRPVHVRGARARRCRTRRAT